MQKPEYLSNDLAACAIDIAVALAAFTVGVHLYCGWIIAIGA